MKAFSTSMMVLLVIAALFFGNCFSCPQMLLARQSNHSCCPGPKPATTSCQTQGTQHFVKARRGRQECLRHGIGAGREELLLW